MAQRVESHPLDRPAPESAENLMIMRLIDEQYLRTPYYGARKFVEWLLRQGLVVNRKRVKRLMRLMGIEAIYQKPNTSKKHPENKIYPYLLRGMTIDRVNQVWCTDITYIRMPKGFLYLVVVMDWVSRKALSWRLSNTMDADFCVEALEEALARYGRPGIFNTDQGSHVWTAAVAQVESLVDSNMVGCGHVSGLGRCGAYDRGP